MIYVCSDLHGRYDCWEALLREIGLGSGDTLYVLGDVIDRGEDGVRILRDMMARPNVAPILGNHELTAAVCLGWLLEDITPKSLAALGEDKLGAFQAWMANGGEPTLRALGRLSRKEREEILEYLRDMELYAQVRAGGRDFVLTHAGLDRFSRDRALEDYELEDFLFCRFRLDAEFWPDRYLVYGHTPTRLLRKLLGEEPSDRILTRGTQIAVDCGCCFGGRLGCLCLDTLEEHYVE